MPIRRPLAAILASLGLAATVVATSSAPIHAADHHPGCGSLTGDAKDDCYLDAHEAQEIGTVVPTPTPTVVLPPTPTPELIPVAEKPRIGMSAPASEWSDRLSETGPVGARRIFDDLANPDGSINLAMTETAAGRMPVISYKIPGNDWAGAAAGKYDTQFEAVRDGLDAVDGQVAVAVHHEPIGDGTASDYAAMQRHVLPLLGAPDNVIAGPIFNGYAWSAEAQGMTDAEIAAWMPTSVLGVAEFIGADTYHGGLTADPGEDAGPKIRNLSAWATRNDVTKLGIGEYNGLNADAITNAGDAILADPRFIFACVFNSNENNREGVAWQLTGERLQAFRNTLADPRTTQQ